MTEALWAVLKGLGTFEIVFGVILLLVWIPGSFGVAYLARELMAWWCRRELKR